MEYGKVLRRAWQITWQYKVLWVLGFLASLSGNAGGLRAINPLLFWQPSITSRAATSPDTGIWLPCGWGLIVTAMGVVSIITWGGLIAGVQQIEEEGSTSFGRAWRVGVKRFWTLFGIGILWAIPGIVMGLILALGGLVSGVYPTERFGTELPGASADSWIGCAGLLCTAVTIPMWLVWLIRMYAKRAAILEGLGWIQAFKHGWQVLRANIGPTLVFGLIFLVIGTIVGEVEATLGRLITGAVTSTDEGASASVAAYAGTLLAILLGALIGSVVNTFSSVTWTLVYRDLVSAGHRRSPRGELEPRAPDHSAPGIDETRKRPSKRKRHKKHSAAQVPVFSIAVAGL